VGSGGKRNRKKEGRLQENPGEVTDVETELKKSENVKDRRGLDLRGERGTPFFPTLGPKKTEGIHARGKFRTKKTGFVKKERGGGEWGRER